MGKIDFPIRKTIISPFEKSVWEYPNNPYLLEKKGNTWESTSYTDVRKKVYRFAAGLMSMSIKKGDRLALLSEGRNDWVISELGILYAGAIDVPLAIKLIDPSEISFRLKHSGCRMIVASGNQAAKLNSLKDELPELGKVILLDRQDAYHPKDILFEKVMILGDEFLKEHYAEFEARWTQIVDDDLANICYTSGTTADPKGIILSHRNYTANVEQALTLMDVPPWYCTLLILPWDHSFAHTAGIYTLMAAGGSLASVQTGKTGIETLKNIPANIRETRPVFLMSVPALANNFRKNIEKGVYEKGILVKGLFKLAMEICKKAVALRPNGAEGHYWLGVHTGSYGETRGVLKSLFLKGDIISEMNKASAIDGTYENGGTYCVLGRLYFKVPGLFGGSNRKSLLFFTCIHRYFVDASFAFRLPALFRQASQVMSTVSRIMPTTMARAPQR